MVHSDQIDASVYQTTDGGGTMQTRPRIKLPDELLYELQHVAVDVAQERCIPNMRVNKLLEEIGSYLASDEALAVVKPRASN